MESLFMIIPVLAVVTLLFAGYLAAKVNKQDAGTDRMKEIAGAINGSRYYGLGELDLYSVKRFAPMTDFQGKILTFTATDFNRLHNPKNTIPPNRKRGE